MAVNCRDKAGKGACYLNNGFTGFGKIISLFGYMRNNL
jgi:TM2 domain-containing membrane protein YozV